MSSLRNARRKTLLSCVVAWILAVADPAPLARAHDYKLGNIMIGHLWSPPSKKGPTFVFGPFLNRGETPDRLVAAASPIAEEVAFCISREKGGGCEPEIALVPGKPYSMAPWRAAVRLGGTNRALAERDSFPLTLTFAKAGKITVEVVVEKASGH